MIEVLKRLWTPQVRNAVVALVTAVGLAIFENLTQILDSIGGEATGLVP